jgi:Peptidase M60, enhancin and enhancin-like/N-terminal domain of M60-like peptidases
MRTQLTVSALVSLSLLAACGSGSEPTVAVPPPVAGTPIVAPSPPPATPGAPTPAPTPPVAPPVIAPPTVSNPIPAPPPPPTSAGTAKISGGYSGSLNFVSDVGVKSASKLITIFSSGTTDATIGPITITPSQFTQDTSATDACFPPKSSCSVLILAAAQTLGLTPVNMSVGLAGSTKLFSLSLTNYAYPAPPQPTGQAVTLAGATMDPSTRTTKVQIYAPGTVEKLRTHNTFEWSDYRSTGIYAKPGESIGIAVGAVPAGTIIQALVGAWHPAGVGDPLRTGPIATNLAANATTQVSNPLGGPVYVRAVDPSITGTTSSGQVSFRVAQGGTAMPLLLLGRDTHEQWSTAMSDPNVTPYVEVVTKRAIITFDTAKVKAALAADLSADMTRVGALFDTMIESHDSVAGLDNSSALNAPRQHPLQYFSHNVPGYYMFAWYGRTGFCIDCAQFLYTKSLMDDGWGVWHETGHMYQGGWEWADLGEVSVNIFSLELNDKFGNSNRLVADKGIVPGSTAWDDALSKRSTLVKFDDLDVFQRLVMFWQLRMGFGPTFWPKLHQYYRDPATRPVFTLDETKRQNFIWVASKIAGQNLIPFFDSWALKADAATIAKVTALNLPATNVANLLALRPF